jgi:hypothetical protein
VTLPRPAWFDPVVRRPARRRRLPPRPPHVGVPRPARRQGGRTARRRPAHRPPHEGRDRRRGGRRRRRPPRADDPPGAHLRPGARHLRHRRGTTPARSNISTAAAFVAAAAGVPVVKHGNRAVSSKSGSADVLRELGVPIESGVEWAQRCLDRAGFAFCYAPHFHPGMAHVAPLRRKLGVRTIFNLLGPLANPASADYQLIGVGNADLLDVLAGALAELNVHRAGTGVRVRRAGRGEPGRPDDGAGRRGGPVSRGRVGPYRLRPGRGEPGPTSA